MQFGLESFGAPKTAAKHTAANTAKTAVHGLCAWQQALRCMSANC